MIWTLADFISKATTMAGGRLDWGPSEVSFWVNAAYNEVATRQPYQTLEALAISSTTSGENRINTPTDFAYPTSLTLYLPSGSTASSALSTPVTLVQRSGEWLDAQGLSSGQPTNYVNFATWLELWPSPDSAYSMQMRYQVRVTTLVNSTSTPQIDERWHPAILHKAVAMIEATRGNVEGELIAERRYQSYIGSTPSDQAYRQRAPLGMAARFQRTSDG